MAGAHGRNCGPGFATPMDAYRKGPREQLMYVVCVQPNPSTGKPDFLATVDVDPASATFCKVIHRTHMLHAGDEIHHSGWNACSSCHGDAKAQRDKLILPALHSDRIYVVDVGKNPRAPQIHKVIEGSAMKALNCSTPHTTHCLASGEVMISTMGDVEGNAKGEFVLVDGDTLEVKGTWTNGEQAKFGYDFWYQPYHDVMVSSEWGAPKAFKKGFELGGPPGLYGQSLNFYSWSKRELIQTIDLGEEGITPLEVRFLHEPKSAVGFVGSALYANLYKFFKKDDGTWTTEIVVDIPSKTVEGWGMSELPGMMSDIIISLDDRFLYFSNWLHGDVRQYDITDTSKPILTGQIFLGGKVMKDQLKVLKDLELKEQPSPVFIKGRKLYGSPQMLQLSLDGKRLYVTSSLYSPWDKQFYPEMIEHGSWMAQLDIDTVKGGMTINKDFLVEFTDVEDVPVLAHEMRYPGGDCTSDIWLAKDE